MLGRREEEKLERLKREKRENKIRKYCEDEYQDDIEA